MEETSKKEIAPTRAFVSIGFGLVCAAVIIAASSLVGRTWDGIASVAIGVCCIVIVPWAVSKLF